MTKMLKMQKIPNLFLLVGRDDQLVYFTMLSPIYMNLFVHINKKIQKLPFMKVVFELITQKNPSSIILLFFEL
jgi:hypothetical protein